MQTRLSVVGWLALSLACNGSGSESGSDSDSGTETDGGSTGGSTDGSTDGSTGGITGTTDPGSTGGTAGATTDPGSTGGGSSMCGNEEVDAEEECDDGNVADGDGCNSACLVECALEWETLSDIIKMGSSISGLGMPVTDAEGNIFIADLLEGTDDDVWVARLDASGQQVWSQVIDGGMGDDNSRLIALTADGDPVIAGWFEGTNGTDLYVSRRSADDGTEMWTFTYDGAFDGTDEEVTGLAVAPSGEIIVTATVGEAESDTDVWIRAMDPADGAEVWTTVHGWTTTNQFSLDRGGPTTVADDGTIYVSAGRYIDYQTFESVLLQLDGSGTIQWEAAVLETGQPHRDHPNGIAIASDGGLYTLGRRTSPGQNTHLIKHNTSDGDDLWRIERANVMPGMGNGDVLYMETMAAAIGDPRPILGGGWIDDDENERQEVFVTRINPNGTFNCIADVGQKSEEPLLGGRVGARPDGGALFVGYVYTGDGFKRWIGSFRP